MIFALFLLKLYLINEYGLPLIQGFPPNHLPELLGRGKLFGFHFRLSEENVNQGGGALQSGESEG